MGVLRLEHLEKFRNYVPFRKPLSKHDEFSLKTYRPSVNIYFENSRMIIKTADSEEELKKVFALRYEVFMKEIQKKEEDGIDFDEFDLSFDHLLLIDKASGDIIGTYRVNCSKFNDKFYSEKEFKMDSLRKLPGVKLELGRACIKEEFRNGITLNTLWKGIAMYASETGSRYLLGCSSINNMDRFVVASIQNYMKNNHYSKKTTRVKPRFKYKFRKLGRTVRKISAEKYAPFREGALKELPPLLMMYLKFGGVVCGKPALDKDFACVDYMTLLDLEKIDDSLRRKYFGS